MFFGAELSQFQACFQVIIKAEQHISGGTGSKVFLVSFFFFVFFVIYFIF
jgi:hypothetical protein